MSLIASIIITLCAIFPTWIVAIALALVSFVIIVVLIKIIGLVLDAVPFL